MAGRSIVSEADGAPRSPPGTRSALPDEVDQLVLEVYLVDLPARRDPSERLRVGLGVRPPGAVVVGGLREPVAHDRGDLVEAQLVGLRVLRDVLQVLVQRRVAAAAGQALALDAAPAPAAARGLLRRLLGLAAADEVADQPVELPDTFLGNQDYYLSQCHAVLPSIPPPSPSQSVQRPAVQDVTRAVVPERT